MHWNDIKGLKYYILYALLLVSFFAYSGMVGWKWFNSTQTEHTRTTRTGSLYRYHK